MLRGGASWGRLRRCWLMSEVALKIVTRCKEVVTTSTAAGEIDQSGPRPAHVRRPGLWSRGAGRSPGAVPRRRARGARCAPGRSALPPTLRVCTRWACTGWPPRFAVALPSTPTVTACGAPATVPGRPAVSRFDVFGSSSIAPSNASNVPIFSVPRLLILEPTVGFEPTTCALRKHCSTTELSRRKEREDTCGRWLVKGKGFC